MQKLLKCFKKCKLHSKAIHADKDSLKRKNKEHKTFNKSKRQHHIIKLPMFELNAVK